MRRTLLAASLAIVALAGCDSKSKPAEDSIDTKIPHLATAVDGSVHGEIRFDGAVPPALPIDMSQDPACVLPGVPANVGQAYQVNKGKLQNVYVYVKHGMEKYRFPFPDEPEVLDQQGCRYIPHVLVLRTGQKLTVRNSDLAMHNVHPAPKQNAAWNISQAPKAEAIEKVFDKPEVMIPVTCNQHPWMKMYVNVSDHPFFAVTGEEGNFKISGLPAGEYTIAAVHERMGEKTMKVTVKEKATASADFTFSAADADNAPAK